MNSETHMEKAEVDQSLVLKTLDDLGERLGRMEEKIDKIAEERRDEAKATGSLETRVSALEAAGYKREQESAATRRVALSAIIAAVGQFFVLWFRR